MWILRLVRNFALLALLAQAAHAAAGAANRGPRCGQACNTRADCHGCGRCLCADLGCRCFK